MFLLAWLFVGSGIYLDWCAWTNHNPVQTIVAWLRGETSPAQPWQIVPPPTSDSSILDSLSDHIFGPDAEQGGTGIGDAANSGTSTVVGTASAKRGKVIEYARAQLGEKYVYGAAGPNTWDCSGLTMMAYKQVGVYLPHNAALQQGLGKATANPVPGDLVFWGAISGHVAIYLGGDQVIHAPQPGQTVQISGLWDKAHISYRTYL